MQAIRAIGSRPIIKGRTRDAIIGTLLVGIRHIVAPALMLGS
jgi:hypothetical protein